MPNSRESRKENAMQTGTAGSGSGLVGSGSGSRNKLLAPASAACMDGSGISFHSTSVAGRCSAVS